MLIDLLGARSIASHTGALAGTKEAYNAIFAQSGVLRVETLEELFDYALAFAYQPIPSKEGTVVVSNAGGPATIMADAAAKYNLSLTRINKITINKLSKLLPKTASLINPFDIIGDADHTRYVKLAITPLNAIQKTFLCIYFEPAYSIRNSDFSEEGLRGLLNRISSSIL